jgi:hypothetical protein
MSNVVSFPLYSVRICDPPHAAWTWEDGRWCPDALQLLTLWLRFRQRFPKDLCAWFMTHVAVHLFEEHRAGCGAMCVPRPIGFATGGCSMCCAYGPMTNLTPSPTVNAYIWFGRVVCVEFNEPRLEQPPSPSYSPVSPSYSPVSPKRARRDE